MLVNDWLVFSRTTLDAFLGRDAGNGAEPTPEPERAASDESAEDEG